MRKRHWKYEDGGGIECLGCGEVYREQGVPPFVKFDRMQHKESCPVQHISGGME